MVKVTLEIPEQILAVRKFKFSPKGDLNFKVSYVGRLEEKYKQRYFIGQLLGQIESFDALPCNASIQVKFHDGRVEANGIISAFTPEARDVAEMGLRELISGVVMFAKAHPRSTFSSEYQQTTEITSVIK